MKVTVLGETRSDERRVAVVEQVQHVRRGASYDIATHDSLRTGLEITGFWNPAGTFVAEDIEPKDRQDPRLRGALQGVDPEGRVLRLYGIDVQIVQLAPSERLQGDAKLAWQRAESDGIARLERCTKLGRDIDEADAARPGLRADRLGA